MTIRRKRVAERHDSAAISRIERLEDRTLLAVNAVFFPSSSTLVVTTDTSDDVAISAAGGQVMVNGGDPLTGPLAAADVQAISVTGGQGANDIDLSAVQSADFTALTTIDVTGGDGNDVITASPVTGSYNGGHGDDVLNGSTADDTLDGDDGHDTINGMDGDDSLIGEDGNDVIDGGDGNDVIDAGDGADSVEGGSGDDDISGGDDQDTLNGGDGNDTLNGGFSEDLIDGGDGADVLRGGAGNDSMDGGMGDDRLYGQAGHDSLAGGGGADLAEGGTGNDFIASADDQVMISIAMMTTVMEGDMGTTNAMITVSLSQAAGSTVSVDFATSDGTAVAGVDYVATTGTVTFTPGSTMQVINVPVIGNTNVDGDRDFFVDLSNAMGGVLLVSQSVVTITDDDVAPPIGGDVLLVSDTMELVGVEQFLLMDGHQVMTITDEFAAGSPNLQNLNFLMGFDFVIWGAQGSGAGDIQPTGVYTTLEQYIQQGGNLLATGYDTIASPVDPMMATLMRSTTTVDAVGVAGGFNTLNVDQFILNGMVGDFRNMNITPNYTDWDGSTADTANGAISLGTFTYVGTQYDAIIYTDIPGQGGSVGYWTGGQPGSTAADGKTDWKVPGTSVDILRNWVFGITGGLGNNVLTSMEMVGLGGPDDDTLLGDEGDDTIVGDFADDSLNGGEGNDSLDGGDGNDIVQGGPGADTVVGNDGDDSLEGNAGDDALDGGLGADTIDGGVGDDFLLADLPGATIDAQFFADPEGDVGQTSLDVTVTLSSPSLTTVTIDFATSDDTATAGLDYQAVSGQLTLAPGESEATISIPIIGDLLDEGDENFFIDLTNASNALIVNGQGVVTIVDDDFTSISINDILVIEGGTAEAGDAVRIGFDEFTLPPNDDGSTGLVPLGFTVNFFGQIHSNAFVNNNGNITFDFPLGTFTPFDLLSTNQEIIAPFFADVDTRGPGMPVTYGSGTANGRPAWGVNWIDVAHFSVGLPLNSFQLIMIDRSDIAPGDFDFEFNYETILWEAGEASGSDSMGLGGSSARVGFSNGINTAFELPGSAVNGAFLDSGPVATSLIQNSLNSTILGRYVFRARDGMVSTDETTADFTVTLSNPNVNMVSVDFATADGTAIAGDDYETTAGTLTFMPGQLTQNVSVPLISDATPELTEAFFVNLSNAVNASIGKPQGVGTILDDDNGPLLDPSKLPDPAPPVVTPPSLHPEGKPLPEPPLLNLANLGGPEDDLLIGGEGNDSLFSGFGDDTHFGNEGDDSLVGGLGNDELNGGAGRDTLRGGDGNDLLNGGGGADTLNGEMGNDTIRWDYGDDNDQADGGFGTDILEFVTRTNNDRITVDAVGDGRFRVHHRIPSDSVGEQVVGSMIEEMVIDSNGGADRITVDDLTGVAWLNLVTVDAGRGSDLVDASAQANPGILISVLGGNGQDTVIGGAAGDVIDGQAGNDQLTGGPGADTINGSDGVDKIFGSDGDDLLSGDGGRDFVYGEDGDDTLFGGDQNDDLYGGEGNDLLSGDAGDDQLFGELGDDTADGGDGADTVAGGDGDDLLFGGAGQDSLRGNSGNDTAQGGSDSDTIVGGSGNDLLQGGNGSIVLLDDGDDFMNGNAGDDTLEGERGHDTLLGGAGVDELDGGFGNDQLNGNAGNDSMRGGEGNDRMRGGMGDDTLNGGDGEDRLFGQGGNDGLSGHDGHDRVNGGGGADTLHGGDGNDTLRGGAGIDLLIGHDGNDNLNGQGGDPDTLVGEDAFDILDDNGGLDEVDNDFVFVADWINAA